MDLPVFQMMINPDEGSDIEVTAMALVDKPAIERNFLAFKNQQLYFKADEEKRIISGPAMVPDTLIYRRDETGEYNVFFSADTVKQIAIKFAAKGYAKQLNLFHDPNMPADGVVIFNSFISDKSMGISPMAGFEDLPDGTWFISAKVDSDDIWAKIKAGEVRGFSVEGNFSMVRNGTDSQNSHLEEKTLMSDIKNLLAGLKSFLFDTNIQPTPAPTPAPVIPAAQSAVKTKDGIEVSVDKMEVGGVVMIAGAPAAAGEIELEDGTKVTIGEGGVISAIVPGAAPEAPDFTKQFSEITEKLTGYEQRFSQYEQKISAYDQQFAKQTEQLNAANSSIVKLLEIVEKLAETPTAAPASTSGASFSTNSANDKEAKRKDLMDRIKKARDNKAA